MLNAIWGAIIGDYIGSAYEGTGIKGYDLPLTSQLSCCTDDTVLLVATMRALQGGGDFAAQYMRMLADYPDSHFGSGFRDWADGLNDGTSWGNGAAMRVAPVVYRAGSLQEACELAKASARCSHDHPEAMLAAEAVACALYMIRQNDPLSAVKTMVELKFFPLDADLHACHESTEFSTRALDTVPLAIQIALQANSFEDAMRKGLYAGGDTDTVLCIAGALAAELHPVPEDLLREVRLRLSTLMPELYASVSAFEESTRFSR